MTPHAARAVIAAHLTDALDLAPHLATRTADDIADRLATEGWELTSADPGRSRGSARQSGIGGSGRVGRAVWRGGGAPAREARPVAPARARHRPATQE